jgi:hypothetical protein
MEVLFPNNKSILKQQSPDFLGRFLLFVLKGDGCH